MDASAAFDAITEFVKLAAEARSKALPDKKKARLQLLDEGLRDIIEGARPAPKRIANPAPAKTLTPAHGVAPAKITVKASEAFENVLELSTKDKSKVNSITVDDLPVSSYTPPTVPAYMADYYGDALVPARISSRDKPTSAVCASGETLDLQKEVLMLLGIKESDPVAMTGAPVQASPVQTPAPASPVEAPPQTARVQIGGAKPSSVSMPAAPRSSVSMPAAPRPSDSMPAARQARPATPTKPPPQPGVPVIVHTVTGNTQRGRINGFNPKAARVQLISKDPASPLIEVPVVEVLAIFFGLARGATPSEPTGTAMIVKLSNDRDVSGVSPDYAEGADALTIVPNLRRGSVDHIWIPAAAVKSIQLL